MKKCRAMKRKALEEVIQRHMNNIEKHCHRVPGLFEPEDIHDLRVGYKKIRAFLRLMQLEKNAGDLEMPLKLKTVYQSCGGVRDLQLFIPELSNAPTATNFPSFINRCKQKLFSYKEQAVQRIEAMHFKKAIDAVEKELPRQLQDNTAQKFMNHKVAAIHIVLLAADHEKDLHTIRKHLKDIIYTTRIYEHDLGVPFPAATWMSESLLTEMANRLGDFNDRCIGVSLLQSGHNGNDFSEEEKTAMNNLQNNWLYQKEEQQQQLLQQVQVLRAEYEA